MSKDWINLNCLKRDIIWSKPDVVDRVMMRLSGANGIEYVYHCIRCNHNMRSHMGGGIFCPKCNDLLMTWHTKDFIKKEETW